MSVTCDRATKPGTTICLGYRIRAQGREAASSAIHVATSTLMRPETIVEVARRRAEEEQPFWKPLCEFLDQFYEDRPDRSEMIAEEPSAAISKIEAASLAASVEYLCEVYELPCPVWVHKPCYVLDAPWYVWEPSNAALRAMFDVESPGPFRRRNIFTERHPLRRKAGPKLPGVDDWWRS